MRTTAVFLALAVSACANNQRVEWGEETETERVEVVEHASSSGPVSAKDYAARFPTDSDCEAEARRITEKSQEFALRLLKACVDRGDFRRMTALTDAPWTSLLAADADAIKLCARVVAARAGDIENDVKACAAVGIKVATLNEVLTVPEKGKGKIVLFRGRIDAELKEQGRSRLMELALEQGEFDVQPTGRRVSASMGGKKTPTSDGLIIARVVSVIEDSVTNDGEYVVNVDAIDVLNVAQSPTY
jgi:hypothetical protein